MARITIKDLPHSDELDRKAMLAIEGGARAGVRPAAPARPAPRGSRMLDYELERQRFKWEAEAHGLSGLPGGGGINIAHEAVDRHACSERGTHTAIRWLAQDGTRTDYTYVELRNLTNRFANVLRQLDCAPGAQTGVNHRCDRRPWSRLSCRFQHRVGRPDSRLA